MTSFDKFLIGRKEDCGRPKIRTNEAIENVRNLLEEASRTFIRVSVQQTEMSYETCQKIRKKKLHLYVYQPTLVHELLAVDSPQRVEEWFLNTINNDETLNYTFYSDKAWFHVF
ncbi:hypothetical protein BDFB_014381 [Asbolus verrucosus]|uniref:Uncharacterized protein n=1 Tax=Asbolus verrucosus TaxID=1661398 RepID=A0A482VSG1_ASBVE|nr:hypothetical protein BDFB_014381 [Asbolus verrucosus]